MASAGLAKRQRQARTPTYRVVLNVGGTCFETTMQLCKAHSSYLDGLLDSTDWEEDAEHKPEVFLDRDPEIFAHLLRYMRHNIASTVLSPDNPVMCGAILADADFFGIDSLLHHVKATACKHLLHRTPWDLPSTDQGLCNKFDELCGSITEALASGVLPARYFAPSEPKILQLMPSAPGMQVVIGCLEDMNLLEDPQVEEGGTLTMSSMEEWVKMEHGVNPDGEAFIMRRDVECLALVEAPAAPRHVEPLIRLDPDDQQEMMSAQRSEADNPSNYPFSNLERDKIDPNYLRLYPLQKRVLLLSEFIASRSVKSYFENIVVPPGSTLNQRLWTALVQRGPAVL